MKIVKSRLSEKVVEIKTRNLVFTVIALIGTFAVQIPTESMIAGAVTGIVNSICDRRT